MWTAILVMVHHTALIRYMHAGPPKKISLLNVAATTCKNGLSRARVQSVCMVSSKISQTKKLGVRELKVLVHWRVAVLVYTPRVFLKVGSVLRSTVLMQPDH
ncbi:hypothetical protein CHARACLAT_013363 [Characodon lateralis]|uniref:Secreted protein n=1 Tax=Characodon lateralis TaxID=208331 RepID=A0ABU7EJC3_9TELE|nr:hypothetical protein [Characodon lateralis]